jgi:hypothetical protein
MDPVIAQLARARDIQPHFLRYMKQHFINVVQPQLDERELLAIENLKLRAEIETLKAAAEKPKTKAVRA